MAANLPDVDLTTLTSSAQIFSSASSSSSAGAANHHVTYTLPQIRALHKQMHLAIDDKKARLRTQVGGSYRELLGTADAIVRMRTEMDDVQGILGTMGARCGRGVVGAKVGGLARFTGERDGVLEGPTGRRSVGAVGRAKVLAGCVLILGRLLRGKAKSEALEGDTLVVAAKISVLGRLLVKSFEENKPDASARAAVENSVQSLNKLRSRLRKSIDKVLETVGEPTTRGLVLKALCAYSLATNSGMRDVIRHFLDVRGNAMAAVFDVEEHRTSVDVVKGLELYTKTILDVQFLVPKKLAEALAILKRETLLSDPSLREIEGLRLDVYERWCSEHIQSYKPTMRHDDLDGKQAVDMLTSWSGKGSEVLLAGLGQALERTTEFKTLTDMRTEVLQLWIRDGGKARGFDPIIMLNQLRITINTHMASVLDAKVHKLRLVGSEVAATLDEWQRGGRTAKSPALWDVDSLDMDLHRGAGIFAQDVIARLYGRDDAVARAVTGYKSWAAVIDDVESVVEQLKKQRWDNDVDEIEDEETIDERQQALSREDPARLQERLDAALGKAFGDLNTQIASLWAESKEGEQSGRIAMYLLRVLRDVRAKLPKLEAVKGFGLEIVPELHQRIATTVGTEPVDDFAENALARKMVVGRTLWEGDPEMPTSPSPSVFRLLRNLTMAMTDGGTDLWSPAAVAAIKKLVGQELSTRWTKALEAHLAEPESTAKDDEAAAPAAEDSKGIDSDGEKEETTLSDSTNGANGENKELTTREEQAETAVDAAVTEKMRQDLLIQWLFDIALLRCAIGSGPDAIDELKTLEETIWAKTQLEGVASARQRLGKTSSEYWKRSSLLFGLLG